jgi:NAD(P)-dependent dehydrogenase (short-subunit alcohol dehydrogenase family)
VRDLNDKVAVVTGGASGVGRAMAERFAAEGMKIVVADVEGPALDRAVAELTKGGAEVTGVVTDVRDYESVEALRDRAVETYGKVHILCNNAGVGSGAEGRIWEHELNDWRWALEVNVWGVIHGINAFVPGMLAHGEEGRVINTSSGNGGVAPLPSTPVYAVTKSAVLIITECLYAQLQAAGAAIGASVLFPGPHMLRTGLWTSARNRPAELPKAKPRTTPLPTLEELERQMEAAGVVLEYTPVEDVAAQVVEALRADAFWILPHSERIDTAISERAASMLARTNPTYLRELSE